MNNEFKNGFEKVAGMTRDEKIDFIHKGNLHFQKDMGTAKDYKQLAGKGALYGAGLFGGVSAAILAGATSLGSIITKKNLFREILKDKNLRAHLGKVLAKSTGQGAVAGAGLGVGLAGLRHFNSRNKDSKEHFKDISDENLSKGVQQIKDYYRRKNIR